MKCDDAAFTVSLASAGNPDHRQLFDGGILAPGVVEYLQATRSVEASS